MSVTGTLTQIYQEAERKGINLRKFGIHSDEDLIERGLETLFGDLDEYFYDESDDEFDDESEEEIDEEDAWDFSLEDIERIIGRRNGED